KALAARFDTTDCKVDTSVYNPSRISKLPGTMACKGENTAERPHRMARVIETPADLLPVPTELLQAVVDELLPVAAVASPPPDDVALAADALRSLNGAFLDDYQRWLEVGMSLFKL